MIINNIKNLFKRLPDDERQPGLLPLEWAMAIYTLFTLGLMALWHDRLYNPADMLLFRLFCTVVIVVGWLVCKVYPSRITLYLRTCVVMTTLTSWYPDIFEFTRLQPNLDHVFAHADQLIYGCQPSLIFSLKFPQMWISEPLYMGYASYFFMSTVLLLWALFVKPQYIQRCAFVITAGFFAFYVVYIFLPVAGPQYYYLAPGVDAASGVFPDVGHYFSEVRDLYPAAGQEGFFHTLVNVAHEVGERPIAAFPSSHVGVATIILMLAIRCRAKSVFYLLSPLYLLLCVATVYIHAHYAIDAIAGFFSAVCLYYLLNYIYNKVWKHDV